MQPGLEAEASQRVGLWMGEAGRRMASEGLSALGWRKSIELFVLASLTHQGHYCSRNHKQGIAQGRLGCLWSVPFSW